VQAPQVALQLVLKQSQGPLQASVLLEQLVLLLQALQQWATQGWVQLLLHPVAAAVLLLRLLLLAQQQQGCQEVDLLQLA
jgi:hypothetical protein